MINEDQVELLEKLLRDEVRARQDQAAKPRTDHIATLEISSGPSKGGD